MRKHRAVAVTLAILLILALAAAIGTIGCGGASELVTTTYAASYATTATTAASSTTVFREAGASSPGVPSYSAAYDDSATPGAGVNVGGTLTALESAAGQKIISDAQIEIEVEAGKFQVVFDQALMLATRYGGYLMSSNSYASGDTDAMRSGVVAIRVPSTAFAQALVDARSLGTVKSESLSSQDVTEEYVDLQARIKNSEAHVNSLVALLAQAKTIDDILQVQSVLTYAQQELEQLKGRLSYLDEHTNYSTVTMSIYEKGTEPVVPSTWGTGGAASDALHYLVKVFNGILKGLGVLIPVIIVLAILACIVYLIVRAVVRRNRQKQQAPYQSRPPQGWGYAGPAGPVHAQTAPPAVPTSEPAGDQVAGDAGAGGPEK